MPPTCIMIISGEVSGDMYGAMLARSIRKRSENCFLFGVGGSAMESEGVRIIVSSKTISVVGITEVLSKLPTIYQAMKTVKYALNNLKPDLLILIDFPDFNFRVAAVAKKLNIPILYYISPQIWAWRQNRVKKIKRLVDHMAVIFPFEEPFYRKHQVPVTFVGHPLLDRISPPKSYWQSKKTEAQPVIGLLPGSRDKEVSTLLPVMLEAANVIRRNLPTARFIVSCAESIQQDEIRGIINQYGNGIDLEINTVSVVQVFKQSQLIVAASGTVTLEAALHGIPMVIVYKVSPLSYWLGKRLIKVKHIGIVNLIVDNALLPELIQDDASPRNIAETVTAMITDRTQLIQIEEELLRVRNLLGGAGASDRVARIALDLA